MSLSQSALSCVCVCLCLCFFKLSHANGGRRVVRVGKSEKQKCSLIDGWMNRVKMCSVAGLEMGISMNAVGG